MTSPARIIIALLLAAFMLIPVTTAADDGDGVRGDPGLTMVKVTEKAEDVDGDGLYEHIWVTVKVNVTVEGKYRVGADLYTFVRDGEERKFVYLGYDTNVSYLAPGVSKVLLKVNGQEVEKHGIDGPYHLDASVENLETGGYADLTMRTAAYFHGNFTPYLEPVEFTGEWEEFTQDGDGDGKYDRLGFNAGVIVREEGVYMVGGSLTGTVIKEVKNTDPEGNVVIEKVVKDVKVSWTAFEAPLFTDTPRVEFLFDGPAIYSSGVDGPYMVSLWISEEPWFTLEEWRELEEWEDEEGWEEDGDPGDPETGEDLDGDGRPDTRGDEITDPDDPGDPGGEEVPGEEEEYGEREEWEEGWEEEGIPGEPWDDPFWGMPRVFLKFKSDDHSHKDFQVPRGPVEFTGEVWDEGLDEDGDGLFEALSVSAEVDVAVPGEYVLGAALFTTEKVSAEDSQRPNAPEVFHYHVAHHVFIEYLEEGTYPVAFDIPGGAISQSGIDGPYTAGLWVEEMPWPLWEEEGEGDREYPDDNDPDAADKDGDGISDPWENMGAEGEPGGPPPPETGLKRLIEPRWPGPEGKMPYDLTHTTVAYSAGDFTAPEMPARFTGEARDHGTDRDGDGLFETLTVSAAVEVEAGGNFGIYGELLTAEGWFLTSVEWREAIRPGTFWLELDFTGGAILKAGVDGPYLAIITIQPLWREDDREVRPPGEASDSLQHLTGAYTADEFDGQLDDKYDGGGGAADDDGARLSSDDEGVNALMDVLGVRFSKNSPRITFFYVEEGGREVSFTLSYLNLIAYNDRDLDGHLTPGEEMYAASLTRTQWSYQEPSIAESDALGRYISFSMTTTLEMMGQNERSDVISDWGDITFRFTVPEKDITADGEHSLAVSGGSEVRIEIIISVDHPVRASGLVLEAMLIDDAGGYVPRPDGGNMDPTDPASGAGVFVPGSADENGITLVSPEGEDQGYLSWADSVSLTLDDGTTTTEEVAVSYEEGPGGLRLFFTYPYSSSVEGVEHSPTVGVVEENAPDKEGALSALEKLMLNPWLYVITVLVIGLLLLGMARRRGEGEDEGGDDDEPEGDWEHRRGAPEGRMRRGRMGPPAGAVRGRGGKRALGGRSDAGPRRRLPPGKSQRAPPVNRDDEEDWDEPVKPKRRRRRPGAPEPELDRTGEVSMDIDWDNS